MISLDSLKKEENLLLESLAASVLLHFLLFHAGDLAIKFPSRHEVEIDITNMGRLGAPLAVRKPGPPPAPPKPAPKSKEWLKPPANKKLAPAPVPTQPTPAPVPEEPPPASSAVPGEVGIGTGEGGEGQLSRLPQLLNLSDLGAILKRFYPQKALADGREASVVLDIHIASDGHVTAVEVVQSGDPDFDDAARHAARLLRFRPAFLGSQPVAVKMRQAIQFRIER